MDHRPRTHGARFNCNKQLTLLQAVVTHEGAGFAQGNDLSVSRGIVVGEITIPAAGDKAAIADNNGTDRHFPCVQGALRRAQSFFHPGFVRAGHWSFVVCHQRGTGRVSSETKISRLVFPRCAWSGDARDARC